MPKTSFYDKLIFEKSRHGRRAFAQAPADDLDVDLPANLLREDKPGLPEAFAEHLNTSNGPVLAYCRSGQRCAYLYMSVQPLLTATE